MAPIVAPRKLNKAQEFLDSVLGKLPEAEREAARSLYSQAQDEVSGLARDLDAGIATVNQTAEQQQAWYAKHKDKIEGATPNPITAAVDTAQITKDLTAQLAAQKDELAGQGLYLASVIPTIVAQHSAEFGEVLDAEKLVKDAIAANVELKSFYAQSVATRRSEKAAATRTAELAAAEAKGREAGLKEAGNGHIPFPVGSRTPTTLSGLRKPADAAAASPYSLEAAVATATEVANRQAQ